MPTGWSLGRVLAFIVFIISLVLIIITLAGVAAPFTLLLALILIGVLALAVALL